MCSLQRDVTSSEGGHLPSFIWSLSCKILRCSSAQAFLMPETVMSLTGCVWLTLQVCQVGPISNGCCIFSAAHEQEDFVPWGISSKRTKTCFFLFCFFFLKDELIHELKQTLNAIKLEEKGVYVQASTLGSLEALLEFLKTSEVPVSTTVLYLMPVILCFSQ